MIVLLDTNAFLRWVAANGLRLLGIELDDVAAIENLPLHHRDPFVLGQ